MKKIIALILALVVCMALASCAYLGDLFGSGDPTPTPAPTEKPRVPIVRGDSAVIFDAKSGFDIVYPTGSDEDKAVAEAIVGAVTDLGLSTPAVIDIGNKMENQCELLIGDTGRAISDKAKAAIEAKILEDPHSAHWIWIYDGGRLALYANTPFAYDKAVDELAKKYYKAGAVMFKKNANDFGFFKISVPVVENEVAYVFGSTEDFSIVYGTAGNAATNESVAGKLVDALEALGITASAPVADSEKEAAMCEILIGETDRELSAVAKAMINSSSLTRDAWAWVYRDGQLAICAINETAYESAIAEFCSKYYSNGAVKVPTSEAFDGGSVVHDAYMSYESFDNFYDGYADPFGMKDEDYKKMTIKRVSNKRYDISYVDQYGGTFVASFLQRSWGVWAMGDMVYTDSNGTNRTIADGGTDSEFVLRIGAKTPVTLRSGNHGNYPGDDSWKPYNVDETSSSNDRLLDMTFYDAKTGEKITLLKNGSIATVNGLRIVMHHNVYEINYKQENVLANVERSYLYNGNDVMLDTKLYMTQDVKLDRSFSYMFPVYKEYGNCAVFYREDGSSYFMKTQTTGGKDHVSLGIEATEIDLWGENNPAYHIKISVNNPEDMYRSSVDPSISAEKGYAGLRNMQGGAINKIYGSLFSDPGELASGDELHFNTTWSFSYEPDFVNPDQEPDRWVGLN